MSANNIVIVSLCRVVRTALLLLICSGLAVVVPVASGETTAKDAPAAKALERTAAGHPLEAGLDAYLGKPAFAMQRVFEEDRIPNIAVAVDGTILALFGTPHKHSLRLRRSQDGGKTWTQTKDFGKFINGGGMTVDEQTGDIFVFMQTEEATGPIIIHRSSDNGLTWKQQPTVIAKDSLGHELAMHMNEHGITLRRGPHPGRLLRTARYYAHTERAKQWRRQYTSAIYSDDHGKTWQASETFPARGTGEAAVAELSDGTICYNSRRHAGDNPRQRWTARSSDGGQTWKDLQMSRILPDGPQHTNYGCMGGLTRLPVKGRDILLYSNSDSPGPIKDIPSGRRLGTVSASFDGGKTWPVKRLLAPTGGFGYSSMASGRPGTQAEGLVYLHFAYNPDQWQGSKVAVFNLSWILGGKETGDGHIPDWVTASKDAAPLPDDVALCHQM